MSAELKKLDQKLDKLEKYILNGGTMDDLQARVNETLGREENGVPYSVFITVCNTKERAAVNHGVGDTLQTALDAAIANTKEYIKQKNTDPVWVKIEITNSVEVLPAREAANKVFLSDFDYFYRRGISLDKSFDYAFTEGELNGNRLLNYKDKAIDLRKINDYLLEQRNDVFLDRPEIFVLFNSLQYFIDENEKVYSLYNGRHNCGRRVQTTITQKDLLRIIGSSSRYLARQLKTDGSFYYGFFPLTDHPIKKYNILRHASSLWSLICAASISSDKEIYQKMVIAVNYALGDIAHFDGFSYLVDKVSNEIKLGGNSVLIICLTQYMQLFESDKYVEICEELGEGILRMMDPETGTFVHVLNYPELDLKDKYRIVYYDGEAAFALTRLYSLTGDEKWIKAAQKAVDHFIEADYTQYRDHWVAYAVNELTKYIHDEKYYEFGLKNVELNRKKIFNQKTSYHTYLEMLMASFEMYDRMLTEKIDVKYLEKFNGKAFIDTIFHRAHFMLNGYGYPEYVMYFKKPEYFKGSFFIRHDSYRTRIDDVQHFCGAYISLYRNYDRVQERYKELTGHYFEKEVDW